MSLFYEYGKTGKALQDSLNKQRKLIQLGIKQSLKNVEDVKNFKATQGTIQEITEFERPLSEQIADKNFQLRKAFDGIRSMIKDPEEARNLLDSFDEQDILKFNRYSPLIISEINRNFGNVDSTFLKSYIDNFITQQEETGNLLNFVSPDSIVSSLNTDTNTYMDEKGEIVRYEPFKGKLNDALFEKLENIELSEFMTAKDKYELIFYTDRIRDRIINDIEKLKQKRGILNENKLKTLLGYQARLSKIIRKYELEKDREEDDDERDFYDEETGYYTQVNREGEEDDDVDVDERDFYDDDDEDYEVNQEAREPLLRDVNFVESDIGLGLRGRGLKNNVFKKNRKPIYGRGIALVQPESKYVSFGKYIINYPNLEDGYIQLRFKSQGVINDDKIRRKIKVSRDMKDLVLDLIEKHKIIKPKYDKLEKEEKDLFKYIIDASKLRKQLNSFGVEEEENLNEPIDEDEKRLKLLIGEMVAGNTNAELKRQLLILITKFILEKRITEKEGEDIIKDLL